jgi:hypothetical protein
MSRLTKAQTLANAKIRMAAATAGRIKYEGNPCSTCGNTLRYVSNQRCTTNHWDVKLQSRRLAQRIRRIVQRGESW